MRRFLHACVGVVLLVVGWSTEATAEDVETIFPIT